jgi:UDP-N-acetylglucosamine 2-epimerase
METLLKKKVVSIVGARPQFIKLAPLARALDHVFHHEIVHTGQHYDDAMSTAFFNDLNIPRPDHHLEVGSGSHALQTGEILKGTEQVLEEVRPHGVVVFGDTNSTLAGALAAVKMGIPCIHVEAGLRSFNRLMPEEINRVATDHICDMLFAPTETAMENLRLEGLAAGSHLTGDIMVDALLNNLDIALAKSDVLDRMGLQHGNYILTTLHRPYNVDDPSKLQKIMDILSRLECKVVFPVHPRTQKMIRGNHIAVGNNISLAAPQGYLDFLCLQHGADRIVTDSGGIQKEAYILNRPCITMRPETEWVETVQVGGNILADPESGDALSIIRSFSPNGDWPDIFGKHVAPQMAALVETAI